VGNLENFSIMNHMLQSTACTKKLWYIKSSLYIGLNSVAV